MNNLKPNPVGIDETIDVIQKRLYTSLNALWGVTLNGYPRAYINQKGEGNKVELFVGGNDYKPLLFSEENKFFFLQGDKPTINQVGATNDLFIVFILNLEELKGSTQREDEQIHVDVITELDKCLRGGEITGIEYGIENLQRLTSERFDSNFKNADIQPYHVFFIKTEVQYELIKHNC